MLIYDNKMLYFSYFLYALFEISLLNIKNVITKLNMWFIWKNVCQILAFINIAPISPIHFSYEIDVSINLVCHIRQIYLYLVLEKWKHVLTVLNYLTSKRQLMKESLLDKLKITKLKLSESQGLTTTMNQLSLHLVFLRSFLLSSTNFLRMVSTLWQISEIIATLIEIKRSREVRLRRNKSRTKRKSETDNTFNKTVYIEDDNDPAIIAELQEKVQKEKKKRHVMSYLQVDKRTTLPSLKPQVSFNIFKILKDAIGKDLSRFWVPVYFNEPLSMLQKICEMMRYDYLLEQAAAQQDSLLRLIYVSAFTIAMYAGTQFRWTKPFNPLLGETFEYKTKSWKYVSEQVSHHPPISAAHWESK